jgi:hypothetical protein
MTVWLATTIENSQINSLNHERLGTFNDSFITIHTQETSMIWGVSSYHVAITIHITIVAL